MMKIKHWRWMRCMWNVSIVFKASISTDWGVAVFLTTLFDCRFVYQKHQHKLNWIKKNALCVWGWAVAGWAWVIAARWRDRECGVVSHFDWIDLWIDRSQNQKFKCVSFGAKTIRRKKHLFNQIKWKMVRNTCLTPVQKIRFRLYKSISARFHFALWFRSLSQATFFLSAAFCDTLGNFHFTLNIALDANQSFAKFFHFVSVLISNQKSENAAVSWRVGTNTYTEIPLNVFSSNYAQNAIEI